MADDTQKPGDVASGTPTVEAPNAEAPKTDAPAAEATAATSTAGEIGEKAKSFVSRFKENTKQNFSKEAGMGIKFGRVAGTGAGLVMVYDGLTRSKAGDQDRSTIARLAEVAAGVGVAGASLAYRR
ncbi:MAG: hypothetical protein C0436_04055 [Alphaproteobacteria bacterium]|nr:hypothetical protein [Alphaproteobacteria bacterium]